MNDVFNLNGKKYNYCNARYNSSRYNERAVEIPIGLELLERYKDDTLEIGAVLPYYSDIEHDCIDLADGHPMAKRVDVMHWQPDRNYKAIVSISTLEHVGDGWVDTIVALNRLFDWLEESGELLVTLPHGYNAKLDTIIRSNSLKLDTITQMNKLDFSKHLWGVVAGAAPLAYNGNSRWANTIYILQLTKNTKE